MQYDAVIFDVGDTLIQYVPTMEEQYINLLRSVGEQITSSVAASMIDAAKQAEYEQLMKEWNGAPRMEDEPYLRMQAEAALRSHYTTEIANSLLPVFLTTPINYDGKELRKNVGEMLQWLKEHAVRLGIVSNDSPRLRKFLEEAEVTEYFDAIVISGEEGIEKPNPGIMQIAMERMSVEPKRCIYVGDHPFDVLCAKHAGMDCAWIASERMRLPDGLDVAEDYRISAVEKIIEILDK